MICERKLDCEHLRRIIVANTLKRRTRRRPAANRRIRPDAGVTGAPTSAGCGTREPRVSSQNWVPPSPRESLSGVQTESTEKRALLPAVSGDELDSPRRLWVPIFVDFVAIFICQFVLCRIGPHSPMRRCAIFDIAGMKMAKLLSLDFLQIPEPSGGVHEPHR